MQKQKKNTQKRISLLLYIFVEVPLLIQIFAMDPAPPTIGL